jgi:CheY-like chemotaxis protein
MRIVLVEDDWIVAEQFQHALQLYFPGAEVIRVQFESEFLDRFDELATLSADFFLIDLLLPWARGDRVAAAGHEDFRSAGVRLAKRLQSDPGTVHVPILISSLMEDRRWASKIPDGIIVIEKSPDVVCRFIGNYQAARTGRNPIMPRVFVAHGHDLNARDRLIYVLEKRGLEPIVLVERPSEGRTVIEMVEQLANVSFAVGVLTPDDTCCASGTTEQLKRARQNVIFELGLCVGRLGRNKVRALVKGSVEIPSDMGGLLHIAMDDSETWVSRLERELEVVGLGGKIQPS